MGLCADKQVAPAQGGGCPGWLSRTFWAFWPPGGDALDGLLRPVRHGPGPPRHIPVPVPVPVPVPAPAPVPATNTVWCGAPSDPLVPAGLWCGPGLPCGAAALCQRPFFWLPCMHLPAQGHGQARACGGLLAGRAGRPRGWLPLRRWRGCGRAFLAHRLAGVLPAACRQGCALAGRVRGRLLPAASPACWPGGGPGRGRLRRRGRWRGS